MENNTISFEYYMETDLKKDIPPYFKNGDKCLYQTEEKESLKIKIDKPIDFYTDKEDWKYQATDENGKTVFVFGNEIVEYDDKQEKMIREMTTMALCIDRRNKRQIHRDFNTYMKHWALKGENKKSYVKKLFNHYNTYFGHTGEYTKEDLDCEDCIKSVTEFWGHIIYGIWKIPIV